LRKAETKSKEMFKKQSIGLFLSLFCLYLECQWN
jgi:hypothetical protein